MQIIPTVLILLSVLGFLAFSFTHSFSSSRTESQHFIAYFDAHADKLSKLQAKAFEKLPKPRSDTKKNEKKETETIFLPRTKRIAFQPLYVGQLTKKGAHVSFKRFATSYFVTLYATVTANGVPVSQKHLESLFTTFLENPSFEKTFANDPFGKKILEGTNMIDASIPKGYPPLLEAFSRDDHEKPIPFRSIPKHLLQHLFSEKQIKQIEDAEKEKSKRANRTCTLNEKEFTELFPVRTQLLHLLHFETRTAPAPASDPLGIIELPMHENTNSNDVPSPSVEDTETITL